MLFVEIVYASLHFLKASTEGVQMDIFRLAKILFSAQKISLKSCPYCRLVNSVRHATSGKFGGWDCKICRMVLPPHFRSTNLWFFMVTSSDSLSVTFRASCPVSGNSFLMWLGIPYNRHNKHYCSHIQFPSQLTSVLLGPRHIIIRDPQRNFAS